VRAANGEAAEVACKILLVAECDWLGRIDIKELLRL
jgi:hypothetical protein